MDGNCNTGDRNTGDRNTGDYNTGDRNTGYYNTGDLNTGNRNTGNMNTGYLNTGNRNTGNYNTGNWNTGDWNTGNLNTGYFCEETPSAVFFDQPTGLTHEQARELIPYVDLPVGVEFVESSRMTDQEKADNQTHATIGGYLRKHQLPIREAFPLWWAKQDQAMRDCFISLPNFDADKFFRITGVDVRDKRRVVEVETVDGQRVKVFASELA